MTVNTQDVIKIKPVKMQYVALVIRGTAPLMTARFSKKGELMLKFQEGNTARGKKERTARDFDEDARAATYFAPEGWAGMNAAAFRNACISACRLVGFKMTLAKLSIFVEADGYDAQEFTPLVKIIPGRPEDPQTSVMHTRNATGVIDLRSRPMWAPGWSAVVRMRWDADQFSLTDIVNLMNRAGMQVGIGEGRPDSRESAGLGYGLFKVESYAEIA